VIFSCFDRRRQTVDCPCPCPVLWTCHRALGSSRQTGFRPQRPGPSSLSEWPAPCLSEPVCGRSAMVVLVSADAPLRVTIAWGAVRGSDCAERRCTAKKRKKEGDRRSPTATEEYCASCGAVSSRYALRAAPPPCPLDFPIAAVPPLPSPGGKVSEEGRASRFLV